MRFKPIVQDGPQCKLGCQVSGSNDKVNERATSMASVGASESNIWRKHDPFQEFAPGTVRHSLWASVEVPNDEPRDFGCHDALQGLLSPFLVGALANVEVGIEVDDD